MSTNKDFPIYISTDGGKIELNKQQTEILWKTYEQAVQEFREHFDAIMKQSSIQSWTISVVPIAYSKIWRGINDIHEESEKAVQLGAERTHSLKEEKDG
jgi:hypothetical protein